MSQRTRATDLAGPCAFSSIDPRTGKETRFGGPCNPPITPIDPEAPPRIGPPFFPTPLPVPAEPMPRHTDRVGAP